MNAFLAIEVCRVDVVGIDTDVDTSENFKIQWQTVDAVVELSLAQLVGMLGNISDVQLSYVEATLTFDVLRGFINQLHNFIQIVVIFL